MSQANHTQSQTANSNPATHNHNEVVNQQFGEQANAYLTSQVHAQGIEFATMTELAKTLSTPNILDLGCGAGHVSFTLAPHAKSLIAYDLSDAMLETVTQVAQDKNLSNITTQQGLAETLPFADNEFDMIVSRFSAHHWQDVGKAMREAYRVLKPSGILLIVDVVSPQQPLLDSFLQTIELLRDNSHVRDYQVSQWQSFVGEAGFYTQSINLQKLTLTFDTWVERMRTPQVYRDAILQLQQGVGQEVRSYFSITDDGSFTTDVMVLVASSIK